MALYGNRKEFLIRFNPGEQTKLCSDAEQCLFGDTPTIGLVNTTYGEKTSAMWLVAQLTDLSEFCGCKEKLTGNPLKQCAEIIAQCYHWLKITELMLFFKRFKEGNYGRFYGSIDPLVITTSLRTFVNEYRSNAIDRHEQNKREAERAKWEQEKCSWEEYCRMKGKSVTDNPVQALHKAF